MPKLNLLLATEIRRRWTAGEKQKELAAAFGVTAPSINAIVHGRLYPTEPIPAKPRPDPRERYRERVLDALRGSSRSSGLAASELAERCEMSPHTVRWYMRDLRRRGLAERVGGGGAETRYRIRSAPSAPVAPRGDRPRHLGFGSHLRLLRGQPHAGEID